MEQVYQCWWREFEYHTIYVLCLSVIYLLTLPHIHGKEDRMDKTRSTHGREKEIIQGIGGKARRKDTARKIWTYAGG
jgi:hypothetical protein